MKISIIISVLNESHKLLRTLQTIDTWGHRDIEIIIIDGGSSDNIIEIFESNKHKIDYFVSEKDNGIYDAWNKGLQKATGEFISFIGAGDYYLPNGLKKLCEIAKGSSALDLIHSKIQFIDQDNNIYEQGNAWSWKKFKRFMNINHPGALHSRQLFINYGYFNDEFKIAGDYEFLLRAGKDLHTFYINEAIFLMHAGGVSETSLKVFQENLNAKRLHTDLTIIMCYFDILREYTSFILRNFLKRFPVKFM